MENRNFGKPLHEHSEDELIGLVNNNAPVFGTLAQYELMRRLSIEDSRTSKRFARWSFGIATLAIIISIMLGITQISQTQNVQITNEPLQTEVINLNK